jgi:nucleotide-binding universal stress UspA family protein
MKILCAADGSKFTKKALAFLTTHENLVGPTDELVVLHIQPPLAPHVKAMIKKSAAENYYSEESEKVIEPIKRFLDRHSLRYTATWVVGHVAEEIIATVKRDKIHMVVMGTHGYGLAGRLLMGSVAQRVLTNVDVPVLLVK